MEKLKIDIISDVHLEFGDLPIKNTHNAQVLVMAGDICVAKDLHDFPDSSLDVPVVSNRRQQTETYRNFFRRVCEQYPNVIYVMGNHEHYHGNFDETEKILRDEFQRQNLPIHLLNRQTVDINGVTFIGTTLWSDFNNANPISMYECSTMMNDYRVIRFASKNYRRLRPQDTLDEHIKNIKFINETLSSTKNPVVVVGHHAPSTLSTKPQYQTDHHINGAYRSDLSNIMLDNPNIRYWIHGHTHDNFYYAVGSTQVVCHPRGYLNYERESHAIDPYIPLTVEVEV